MACIGARVIYKWEEWKLFAAQNSQCFQQKIISNYSQPK